MSVALAANLPDADLLYTRWNGDRLKYMLHHRRYTHILVIAVVGAMLLWAVALIVPRWRAQERTPGDDATRLGGLLLVRALSHLALDWTNAYGVHLFWPIHPQPTAPEV